MNLKHLTDKALLDDTKRLIIQERGILVKLLYHLNEIDNRKLYTELKYQSLHDYCIKELKLNEASAHYRIVTARLMNEIPKIIPKIENGSLSLSNLTLAVKFMKDNKIETNEEKIQVLSSIENLSKRECEIKLYELTGAERPKLTNITIKDETYLLLQRARDLLAAPLTHDELLQLLINTFIDKLEKQKFKTSSNANLHSPDYVTRVISSAIKKAVHERDGGMCTKCGSTHNLQYDHIIPFALGGKSTLENIRLLCFNCNQRNRITAKL